MSKAKGGIASLGLCASGFECGIGIENFNDIKVGDTIEAFVKEEVARELTPELSP